MGVFHTEGRRFAPRPAAPCYSKRRSGAVERLRSGAARSHEVQAASPCRRAGATRGPTGLLRRGRRSLRRRWAFTGPAELPAPVPTAAVAAHEVAPAVSAVRVVLVGRGDAGAVGSAGAGGTSVSRGRALSRMRLPARAAGVVSAAPDRSGLVSGQAQAVSGAPTRARTWDLRIKSR